MRSLKNENHRTNKERRIMDISNSWIYYNGIMDYIQNLLDVKNDTQKRLPKNARRNELL